MADYRFSAQAISRGRGQSSVASAAYRAAERLDDERTGHIHDYTRKRGVIYTAILTPAQTPDWMRNRRQLWNAVEAVETRKNAQLAREIQLSLPHELTHDQRRDLVCGFVQEQFVTRGMIADIAIHLPDTRSDDRNHHAHIMLTMRELTAEGFHAKKATPTARGWNSEDLLQTWRKAWADHQNRTLERHGHAARVDHRSYAAQGIEREATHHRGFVANDMERRGKPSRIGDENLEIATRNSDQAKAQAVTARQRATAALHRRHLDKTQGRYDTAKATIRAEIAAIDRRLAAKGVAGVLRRLFGRTKADATLRASLADDLAQIDRRERIHRKLLERQHRIARQKQARAMTKLDTAADFYRAYAQAYQEHAPRPRRAQTPTQGQNAPEGHSPTPDQDTAPQRPQRRQTPTFKPKP